MTFRITDWHPPIDGVARAESRYHVIDGFGASGACRRAHRHDGADDAFSKAHLAAASVRAVEAAPVVHLLPLLSNRCAASRRHSRLCRVFGGVGESYIDGGFSCGTWCQAPHGVDAGVSSDGEITTLGTRSGIPVSVRLATFISPCENASNWRNHDLQPNRRQCPL